LIKGKANIDRFIENYYWVNFQWGESKEYTKKELLSEKQDLDVMKKELAKAKKKIETSLKEKKEIVKEISKKEPIIKKYIEIFDRYAVLHDYRKEGQVKSVYYIRKIYKEFSKRMKIDLKLLYYLWPMEIVEAVRKNKPFDAKFMKERSKEYFCEYDNTGKSKEYYGAISLKKRDNAIGIDIDEAQKELSGMGASQGRVIGNAKVCLSAEIANKKISEGDILVTGMTMPEFVYAMKKAAAVVTDEGGLTCHAAIISRELGVPCVVGTKMATRLIKDGDKVEVNANHGVVKILKKA